MSSEKTQFKKGHKINFGRKMSDVTKKKISDIHKKSGHKPDKRFIVKKHKQESIEKMRMAKKGANLGDKSGMWKGGISADRKKYNNNRYANLSEEERKKESWSKNRRNRLKRVANGSHTFGEWETLKAQYNFTCPCCNTS
jgi:hypothetical protein